MRSLAGTASLLWLLLAAPAMPQENAGGLTLPAGVRIADRQLEGHRGGGAVPARQALVADTVTVVSFTFTGCRSICPVSDLVMSALDRTAGDFRLATITLDPLGDPPDVLAKHAEELGASPRWTFYSGHPSDVQAVLAGLGLDLGPLADHDSFFLIIGPEMRSVFPVESLAGVESLRHAIRLASAPGGS